MEDGARRGRCFSTALGAHPQSLTRAPATSAAARWTREPVRPAQLPEVLPASDVVRKPRPELLIGPRVIHSTDRTRPVWHPARLLHSSRDAGHMYEHYRGQAGRET